MESTAFRTQIGSVPHGKQIDYHSKLVLFGSCFSENIGNKLSYYKFDTHTNPYGVLFNPVSIANALQDCIQKRVFTEDDLFFHNELWHSYVHHSDFSNRDKGKVLQAMNRTIETTHEKLKTASHLFITLGTSWVYKERSKGKVVANCHKVSQREFDKVLLGVPEIVEGLRYLQKELLKLNPELTIIYTVSPVRHLKDGFMENTLSKSHLLTAIHQVKDEFNWYFPSYEIMMDDLREYRFYKRDMLHPNDLAIDYIWSVFSEFWMTSSVISVQKEVENIQKGLAHKPFHSNSAAHLKFRKQLQEKIEALEIKLGIKF